VGSVVHVYPFYTYFPKLFYYLMYIMLIILTVFVYLLMLLTYAKKRNDIGWSKILLSYVIFVSLNYGCIPILGTLLTVYHCKDGVLFFDENIGCNSYDHILIAVFGFIAIILYTALLILASLLYFDTTKQSTNYLAVRVTNIFSIELALRIVLTIITILFPYSESKLWVLSVIIFLGYSYLLYDSIVKEEVFCMYFSNLVYSSIRLDLEIIPCSCCLVSYSFTPL